MPSAEPFAQLQERSPLVVPVIVHVVWHTVGEHVSDEIIVSQLEALNRDFNAQNLDLDEIPEEFQDRIANLEISFCLASKTPFGQPTNGILRVRTTVDAIGIKDSLFFDSTGGSSAWDTERYLNIWVANTGGLISGFGSFPGLVPPYKDGVIINPKYFGQNGHAKYGLGRTLVHETGHYFGLKHVWASDPLCETDDGIEDTPKQQYRHIGCPSYPQKSCTDSDMFMNFMDYVDDPCMLLFTAGQKEKIWANIELFRPKLLSNDVEYYCLHANQKKDFGFKITPNPTFGAFRITLEQTGVLAEIQIFDALGNLRKQLNVITNQELEIDTEGMEPGVYFVQVLSRSGKASAKLLVLE
ncbi:MAG: zinc-dependent metalloprotease [Saprospiraceae bacterium]